MTRIRSEFRSGEDPERDARMRQEEITKAKVLLDECKSFNLMVIPKNAASPKMVGLSDPADAVNLYLNMKFVLLPQFILMFKQRGMNDENIKNMETEFLEYKKNQNS